MNGDDAILEQLQEQTKWLRFLGIQALRPLLVEVLASDKHRLAYEVSDGSRTVRDVAKLAGMGASTVSGLWREWMAIGVCSESALRAGRAQHVMPLSRLGIAVPGLARGVTVADGPADGEPQ
jgi:hypothetical protein